MSPFSRRTFIKSGVLTAAAAANTQLVHGQGEESRAPNQAARGIKVACGLDLWTKGAKSSLDKALDGAAAAGYQWVDGDAGFLWDYRDRHEELQKMVDQRSLGWVTGIYTANFADLSLQNQNVSRTVQIGRVLASLNSDFLTLSSEWGDISRQPMNYHFLTRNLSEVGALVYEDTGLHCAYRFHESEAADIRKIIATSDSRYTKFCFDTLFLMRLGIDPVPMIQTYGERVIHVHLRDGTDEGGKWKEVPVGDGKLNLGAVLQALCESRYNGWVTIQQENIEHSAEDDARQGRKRVEEKLQAYRYQDGDVEDAANQNPTLTRPSSPGLVILQPERRQTLQKLAILGATVSTGFGMLQPAAFSSSAPTGESPMAGMSEAMHRMMDRPIPPLPPKDPYFKPLFFAGDEYRDISALVDAIIPVTDTPGALEARADEYADYMIWLDQDNHERARKQVAGFRQLCSSRYGKNFADLDATHSHEFLTALIGAQHDAGTADARGFFDRIRGLTIHAFYASPQGLLQDLGYKGNTYEKEFVGCTHPEHLGTWYQKPTQGLASGNEPET